MFSFVGDTVLDPFLGSGTTSLVARKLERDSVGYEVNPDFLPLIKENLGIEPKALFEDAKFELITQEGTKKDFAAQIQQLLYIFKDPVKFDKKVDPRKLHFGSRIDNGSAKREHYYQVKEVLSPEQLIVGDGLKVKLLGVKEKPQTSGQAIQFLKAKTGGQKVFLKFDTVKYDRQNNLLCYLYLQNKTFINAHLVKEGLVMIDTETDFKFKKKFERLAEMRVLQE
jgi:site-specific DNA-methyltransferase (adenine-specific)